MNNFDTFQENVDSAKNSEGTLDEASDIYAESWEAAQERVKAAAEGIYDSIFDEKVFITIADGFTSVLVVVEKLVDSMGGLPGVLGLVGTIMTRVFSSQIATSIDNMAFNVRSMLGMVKKETDQFKGDVFAAATKENMNVATNEGAVEMTVLQDQVKLQKQLVYN